MPPSEIQVVLPDGSNKTLPAGATGADLAKAIGPGLAKAALAVRVNGDVRDLQRPLPDGATVSILTNKDPQALDVLRHSSAHALATAVRQLFPQAQIGFGPPIEDGFYYDFDIGRPFGPEDLEEIEKKMVEVLKADYPFVREEVSRAEAKKRFKDDPLKLERIDDLKEDEVISVYTDGPFVDLCRGPHVPSTGRILHFKLRRFIEDIILQRGYQLVYTPNVTREQLFLRSGHLPLYAANQFPAMAAGEGESEDVRYRVKPMNCPMHILIYASQQRSYRDLPIRLAEIANVYRNERSGTLHGMLRVRGLSMDDAHIFLREDQIEQEIFNLLDIVELVLGKTFGLAYRLDLATRPAKKLGDDAMWEVAERGLEQALKRRGLAYKMDVGGGAFYGPKIDVKFNDAIGREWQGATIQLDYELPERFKLEYTGTDNKPHRPVMIHRAIYGTLERFVGFLIEHFAGAFPLWLSPEQVRVLPIADAQLAAARKVHDALRAAGVRSHLDERAETLNYKIRDGETHKVPYMAVVGQWEAEAGTVAIRARGEGKKQVVLPLEEFLTKILEEVRTRSLTA